MESLTDNSYDESIKNCDHQISKFVSLINKFSVLRLITIGLGLFLFFQSLKLAGSFLPVFVAFGVIVAFAFLVRQQNIFEKKLTYFRDLRNVYLNEVASISTRGNMYADGLVWTDDRHPYLSDLDIFGDKSLYHFINRCATQPGNSKLASWLSKRATAEVIRDRQQAVSEIADKPKWKYNYQAMLLFTNKSEDHTQKLFQYMRVAPLEGREFLRFYLKWIPWVFLAFFVLSWVYTWAILPVLCLGIANLLINQAYSGLVAKTDALISKTSRTLDRFSDVIKAIQSEEWKSGLCVAHAAVLGNKSNDKLPSQIKKLSVLIKQLDLGLSSIGVVFAFTMALNVRQFFAIEDWKRDNKANIEEAFDIIAGFEALISLSSLKSNYPKWAFPVISNARLYTLTAQAIGHPLISPATRVENDYTLKDELRIDIITGSNMAGKSTFLRTLGINTVLALAGAPVCAKYMEVSPMLIFSYMRIRDSLNESTSTFKAELDRLQYLLEILSTEDKVFFLIDEMLRGTNSVDKYLGSKAVIEKLIAQKGVGIIATHDLQIAELEKQYPDYIRNFYFDIEIDEGEMRFDYKLKPGECKTFNASLLLKRLGI